MNEETRMKEVKEFEELYQGIKRKGADKLLKFLRESDFYTAPASAKYHNSIPGGLLNHSLNVYRLLKKKFETPGTLWYELQKENEISEESFLIIGLLHDICKTKFYETDYRNQKNYEPETVAEADPRDVKKDNKGSYIWESVPMYKVVDQLPYGHGEKSVVMIEAYMKLTWLERFAIRWHMAFSLPKEEWGVLSDAMREYPIILAVSEADLEATYILEKENS